MAITNDIFPKIDKLIDQRAFAAKKWRGYVFVAPESVHP